jgi:hypothetical protein
LMDARRRFCKRQNRAAAMGTGSTSGYECLLPVKASGQRSSRGRQRQRQRTPEPNRDALRGDPVGTSARPRRPRVVRSFSPAPANPSRGSKGGFGGTRHNPRFGFGAGVRQVSICALQHVTALRPPPKCRGLAEHRRSTREEASATASIIVLIKRCQGWRTIREFRLGVSLPSRRLPMPTIVASGGRWPRVPRPVEGTALCRGRASVAWRHTTTTPRHLVPMSSSSWVDVVVVAAAADDDDDDAAAAAAAVAVVDDAAAAADDAADAADDDADAKQPTNQPTDRRRRSVTRD